MDCSNNSSNYGPYDVASNEGCRTASCPELLCMLYNAYIAIISGKNHVNVSYADRSVSYGRGNLAELKETYQALYANCGAESGLPALPESKMGPKRRPYGVRVCNRGC